MRQDAIHELPMELDTLNRQPSPTSVADFLLQGQSALEAGRLDEAGTHFEQAIAADPFHAGAHSGLSKVYWRMNQKQDALNSLTRALELDPNDRRVILECQRVFMELGKGEDARQILQAYLDRNPWDFEVQNELTAMEPMNFPAANPANPSPDPLAPDLASLFNSQGELQFEQGKLEHARACFEMALEHNPDLALAHSNLGVLCWQQGDVENALNHLNHALELDPEDLDIIYNSSKALAAAGELETAANFLKLYLQRNPRDEEAWNDYATLVKSAADGSWQPHGLDAEVSQVYFKMGRALAEAKDLIGAGQAYQRAIQLNAEQGEPFWGLAQLHMELGQQEDALEILRTGLQVDPAHKQCVLLAGSILTCRTELAEARNLYEKYLEKASDQEVQAALEALDDVQADSDD